VAAKYPVFQYSNSGIASTRDKRAREEERERKRGESNIKRRKSGTKRGADEKWETEREE